MSRAELGQRSEEHSLGRIIPTVVWVKDESVAEPGQIVERVSPNCLGQTVQLRRGLGRAVAGAVDEPKVGLISRHPPLKVCKSKGPLRVVFAHERVEQRVPRWRPWE